MADMLERLFDQERVQRIHEESLIREMEEKAQAQVRDAEEKAQAQVRDIALRSLKHGMSYEEIAAILDLSTAEVREITREAQVLS